MQKMLKMLRKIPLNKTNSFPFFQLKAADGARTVEKLEIVEGSARVQSENKVFYNPVQEFNRDISISVLSTFWQLCQRESEQRKSGKVLGNDFAVGFCWRFYEFGEILEFFSNSAELKSMGPFISSVFLIPPYSGRTSSARSSVGDWPAQYPLCERSARHKKNHRQRSVVGSSEVDQRKYRTEWRRAFGGGERIERHYVDV